MMPGQIAAQLLEMVAGRHAQVLVGYRVVDHLELAEESAFEIGRYVLGAPIVHKEDPQPFIPETNDHPPLLLLHYCTTLRYSSARDVGVEALALGHGSRSLFGVRGRSLGRGARMSLRPSPIGRACGRDRVCAYL